MAKLKYPGSLRAAGKKRDKTWQWRVSLGGQRHAMTFHADTLTEAARHAENEYARLKAELKRRRSGIAKMRTSELLDQYRKKFEAEHLSAGTKKRYNLMVRTFRRYFEKKAGNPLVERVTPAHISDYMTWRAPQIASVTLRNERTFLRMLFSYAEEIEVREGNPVPRRSGVRKDKREPIILSHVQYERLLQQFEDDPMMWMYVLTLGETGMRCNSEALHLRWTDLNFDDGPGWIHVPARTDLRTTKTRAGRHVPMTSRLRAALLEHVTRFRGATYQGRSSPWVFHHNETTGWRRRYAGKRYSRRSEGFDNGAERAGMPQAFVQHDLRHRRITTWLAEGKPIALVQRAVGHEDINTTMAYTHLVRDDLIPLVQDTQAAVDPALAELVAPVRALR